MKSEMKYEVWDEKEDDAGEVKWFDKYKKKKDESEMVQK